MKRDLLADLFRAFDDEAAQSSKPAAIQEKLCRNLPDPPFSDRHDEIIRQFFADYEDEEKHEIIW